MVFYRYSPLLFSFFCFLFFNIDGVKRSTERIIFPGAIEEVYLNKMRNLEEFNTFTGENFTLDNVPIKIYKQVANLSTQTERDRCRERHRQRDKEVKECEIKFEKRRFKALLLKHALLGSFYIMSGVALAHYAKPLYSVIKEHGLFWKVPVFGCALYGAFTIIYYLHSYLEDIKKTGQKYNLVADHLINFLTKYPHFNKNLEKKE